MIAIIGPVPAGSETTSVGAQKILRSAPTVLVCTAEHPAVSDLAAEAVAFEALGIVNPSPVGHCIWRFVMESETGRAFEELVDVIARLRGEGGCPWDRQQTHESLKKYLLEETYEVVDAIDGNDTEGLRSELGDLLIQILFHAQLAHERDAFDIRDAIRGITEKLIRRHPHVFGESPVATTEEVLHRWEQIKAGEPGAKERTSILDGVPRTLPALARAVEVSKRAAAAGFEWPDIEAVFEKLREEVGELQDELAGGDRERIAQEIGDLLFTVVNVARWAKVDPEDALRTMISRFTERFMRIEEAARASGKPLEQMGIREMDAVWNRAKAER